MKKSTLQRIEEIKRTGYNLDLGEAINSVFGNYKKIALLAGAVILLVGIVALVVIGGAAAIIVGVAALTESLTEYGSGVVTSTALIANLIGSVIGAGLFAPVAAGIIQMAHNAEINEDFDFGTAFMHYKTKYFKELFFSAIIITLAGSGLSTGLELLKLSDPTGSFVIAGTVIGAVISILVSLFTLVTIPLIIFGDLKAIDAIKSSFVLVSKNFWIILLLAIIVIVFIFLGIIALCIGIIFTLPAMYSLQYVIYKTALPIDETNELDEIGSSRF